MRFFLEWSEREDMINLDDYYQGTISGFKTEEIAQALLGCLLVNETKEGRTAGFIVETEAYVGVIDEAAHSFNGRNTKRIQAMFERAGSLYVHQMHSHVLVNIVTQEVGEPEGVLIRALEPVEGISIMEMRRKRTGRELTNGPGKLSQALGITMAYNLEHIQESNLSLEMDNRKTPGKILKSGRIGINNKGSWTDAPLRFYVKGNPYVSRFRGEVSENLGWRE